MNNHIRFCQIVLALCLEHLHDNLQVQHHLRERSERQDAEMEMVNGRPLKSICRYVQSFLKKIVIPVLSYLIIAHEKSINFTLSVTVDSRSSPLKSASPVVWRLSSLVGPLDNWNLSLSQRFVGVLIRKGVNEVVSIFPLLSPASGLRRALATR